MTQNSEATQKKEIKRWKAYLLAGAGLVLGGAGGAAGERLVDMIFPNSDGQMVELTESISTMTQQLADDNERIKELAKTLIAGSSDKETSKEIENKIEQINNTIGKIQSETKRLNLVSEIAQEQARNFRQESLESIGIAPGVDFWIAEDKGFLLVDDNIPAATYSWGGDLRIKILGKKHSLYKGDTVTFETSKGTCGLTYFDRKKVDGKNIFGVSLKCGDELRK